MTKKMSNSSEIIFPKDEKTKLVRPLEHTKEDYNALARCYNAFKDSDSWPEGFEGSLIFTGEYLEKELNSKDLSTHFIVNAPDKSGKIVGCGYCNRMWNIPNGWYVELLGVDPEFQKQKLGKALLLNATQYATEKKARIISLETWAGNLKAMPLYKRQGYKWRPKTSAFMENYIPQILNYPFFYEFFSTNSWYETFKPIMTQEPDLEFDDKMAIYEYLFSADENNTLIVWIDRTVGRICGFHKRSETGEDLLIKARTPNSEAFIGLEEFPITLEVINNGKENKKFMIKLSSTAQITLNEERIQEIELPPNSERKMNLTGFFLTNTDELDLKVYTDTYSNHEITFTVMDKETEFPITIGKVPINKIQVRTEPLNFNTIADSTSSVYLKLQNNTNIEKSVDIEIIDGKNIHFQEHNIRTTISPFDTDVVIPIRILATETMVDNINVLVKSLEGQVLIEKDLPVTIFNTNKAVSYEIDRQIFIENKNVRVSIYKTSQTGANEVIIEDKMRGTKVHGHAIKLGYPFDDECSEFNTIDHDHEIVESKGGLWLYSSAESKIKEKIKVTRQVFIPNDNEPLSVSWKIENNSEKPAIDLGILVTSDRWEGRHPVTKYVYPFQEGIVNVTIYALPVDLGKDRSSFAEGWKATEFSTGTVGMLFDQNNSDIEKIHISHMFLFFEHKFELKTGETYQIAPLWYTFVDNWKQVRKAWLDKFQHSPENKYEPYLPSVSHKRFGLMNKNTGNDLYKALFLDRSTDKEIEVTIDAFRETTFKGTVELKVEGLTHKRISLPNIKSRIWSEKIKIDPPNDSNLLKGKYTFDSSIKSYQFPIALGFYNSSGVVQINKVSTGHQEYYEVTNGLLTFRGSSQHRGTVFYLSTKNSNKNLLLSHYPEVKPLLWFNEFYGGIGAVLRPENLWGYEDYNRLKFEQFEVKKGIWKGFGVKSEIITYSPKIKGLQVATNFLTLPNSPFLLIQLEIINHSGAGRKFDTLIRANFPTTKSDKDAYFVRSLNGEIARFHIQDYESSEWHEKDPYSKWAAYKKANEDYLIAMILSSTLFNEIVTPYSPNFSIFMLNMSARSVQIKPNESLIYNVLFFLTDHLEKIEPFINSNFKDLL